MYERLNRLKEQLLGNKNNTYSIDISKQIEERTNKNYPLAGKIAQKSLKEANMKVAENN